MVKPQTLWVSVYLWNKPYVCTPWKDLSLKVSEHFNFYFQVALIKVNNLVTMAWVLWFYNLSYRHSSHINSMFLSQSSVIISFFILKNTKKTNTKRLQTSIPTHNIFAKTLRGKQIEIAYKVITWTRYLENQIGHKISHPLFPYYLFEIKIQQNIRIIPPLKKSMISAVTWNSQLVQVSFPQHIL